MLHYGSLAPLAPQAADSYARQDEQSPEQSLGPQLLAQQQVAESCTIQRVQAGGVY